MVTKKTIPARLRSKLFEVWLNAPTLLKSELTQPPVFPTLAPVPAGKEQQNGEVSEWLKEHAWKVCIRQRIEGSNPSLTATFEEELVCKYGLFFRP